MKASELRIGNYVNYNGTFTIIDLTDFRDFLEKESDIINYKPIQLKEKWLLEFGFEDNTEEMVFYGNNIVIYWRKFENHIEINGEKYFKKYVHQLQNLYFALTEEELIIK